MTLFVKDTLFLKYFLKIYFKKSFKKKVSLEKNCLKVKTIQYSTFHIPYLYNTLFSQYTTSIIVLYLSYALPFQ